MHRKPTFNSEPLALAAALALIVFVSGCSTISISPREAFFHAYPNLRHNYDKLQETSVEELERAATFMWWPQIRTAQRLRADFSKDPELVKRLDYLESNATKMLKSNRDCFAQMSRDINPQTDTLFYYSYREDRKTEDGWLIFRNGRIHKKYLVGTGTDGPMK
jgi:hypothetical protein